MVIRISHIDAIARKMKRDVFFIEFSEAFDKSTSRKAISNPGTMGHASARSKLITWLWANQIRWKPCAGIANLNWVEAYRGQIYLDVVCDPADATYQRVINRLENAEGESLVPGVRCMICTLEVARTNSHHDAPGFWNRWAESF